MYASCFLSLISWILDSCVICASYNLFLYVYFSALISSASFRLLTAFLCSSCRSAFNFSKLLFSAFSLLRSSCNNVIILTVVMFGKKTFSICDQFCNLLFICIFCCFCLLQILLTFPDNLILFFFC